MSISKKLTAGLVAAVMTLGMAVSSFAALPTDVVDSPYEESIETLGALGIMIGDDDGLFRPNATIKRSEFAKVAVTTMGLGNIAESSNYQTKFPDVVSNHWANGYINVAVDQGIIIGDDEGNFRPDDSISYAEAMTMLVRITGYEPSAESKGGFPTGYMVVGSQNGISKNAVATANESVIRGMVAQMTFNALTINMMEQTGFGKDEKYEVVDKTLLEDVLNVEKNSGQITALGISSINGSSSLRDNEIRIDDQVYTVSEQALPAVRNLLGFNVTYYVAEQTNGDRELILARADKNKNHVTTVATDDIEKVTAEEGKDTVVSYWLDRENDKNAKNLIVAEEAQMIYNGKAVAFDAELMQPESGRITFLDVDNDDVYDLVFVTALTNIVVENVLTNSHKVTDKYGNPSLVLDPDDKDIKFTITRGGQIISLADLAEWDVLSVAKSLDGTILSIEVSSNKITGKVEEIEDDKRTINGEQYEIAANYKGDIKLGDEGTFYLDVEGKIAAVDTASTLSSNYAYAVQAGLTSGFDKVLEIKLFNKEGETVVLEAAEKVRLNGASGKTAAQVFAALQDGEENFVPQLITYELNSKGEISQLNTAKDLTDSGTIDRNHFALNAEGEMTYKKASQKLGSYRITDTTLVLNIPAGETDPDQYAVEKVEFFDDNESYDVLVYDAGEDFAAKVVIVTSSTASASVEAPIAVVDQIAEIQNDSNERVQKLYAYQNGERVSFETETEALLVHEDGTALKKGDIIQLKLNTQNEISGIRVLFKAADKDTEFATTVGTDLELVYGRVIKKFANSMNVQVEDGAVTNYSLDDVTVYEYNSTKNKNAIRVVDANEITQYDDLDPSRVFVKIYKDVVEEIVIVK
ncbi:MAG: S-layer homology domain-containing protein [Ruminococcaceae bacterium]|nr:S-layer homology domain-containing protein [Oscillospiraceae bacterium]